MIESLLPNRTPPALMRRRCHINSFRRTEAGTIILWVFAAMSAGNADHDIVQMPDVARAWHLALEATDVIRPIFRRLAPRGLVGRNDATLERHSLDKP